MSTAIPAAIDQIKLRVGITGSQIAKFLSVTPETVSRWKSGKTSPTQNLLEELLQLEWLVKELSSLFNPVDARIWLYTPNPMLDGNPPAKLIQQGHEGRDRVLQLIELLHDGAFA